MAPPRRGLIDILVETFLFHGLCCAEIAPYYTSVHEATSAPQVSFCDYIVIGGGTSGCPLAATLSQSAIVLVLERGGVPYGSQNIENMANFAATLSDKTPNSPSQSFISEGGVDNARARVLGGGSALNAGFYTRASEAYVREAGWDERIVLDAYKCVERIVAFEPSMLQWQSAVRNGLLEAGVSRYNGFTFDHLYGTKVGRAIFDRSEHRHAAVDLLEYADPNRTMVYLHSTVLEILFVTVGRNVFPL